ncbi:hypothetical protein AB0L70_35375 [Kribbella sp. NPDC051952]|uniref:hypothetical protein n=1 Tax=Kribbella sp. NPDC051952 TaxID=3154851 RepID=UPI00342FFFA2
MTTSIETDQHEDELRSRPGALRWLGGRWPSIAGAAVAALTMTGASSGSDVAPVVVASGAVYLGSAALQRRTAAWPMFLVTFVLVGVRLAVPDFKASWWMLVLVGVLSVYGLARGAVRPTWGLPLQAAAMLALAAVALPAEGAGEVWAGVLVSGALLAHAGWDVVHHRAQRVVSRSLAEFCAVLDTAVAVAVLVVTFS